MRTSEGSPSLVELRNSSAEDVADVAVGVDGAGVPDAAGEADLGDVGADDAGAEEVGLLTGDGGDGPAEARR